MNTIIGTFVLLIFSIPILVLSVVPALLINVVIAATGTDFFDCWVVELDYCYEEGGEFYIPEPPIKPSESSEAMS